MRISLLGDVVTVEEDVGDRAAYRFRPENLEGWNPASTNWILDSGLAGHEDVLVVTANNIDYVQIEWSKEVTAAAGPGAYEFALFTTDGRTLLRRSTLLLKARR